LIKVCRFAKTGAIETVGRLTLEGGLAFCSERPLATKETVKLLELDDIGFIDLDRELVLFGIRCRWAWLREFNLPGELLKLEVLG
jgi:hypothetical protein